MQVEEFFHTVRKIAPWREEARTKPRPDLWLVSARGLWAVMFAVRGDARASDVVSCCLSSLLNLVVSTAAAQPRVTVAVAADDLPVVAKSAVVEHVVNLADYLGHGSSILCLG